MIPFFQKLSNVEVKIVCADIPQTLTRLCSENISISCTKQIDEFELILFVHEKYVQTLSEVVNKCGGEIVFVKKSFPQFLLESIRRHFVISIFAALLASLFYLLPSRIIFIEVLGNQYLDSTAIRAVCNAEGLHPGVKRKEIRSEQIKNALIREFPQIIWAGVNTYGACAIISIMENSNYSNDKLSLPCDVVAVSDGVIQSIEVKEGTPRFREGDAVKKGDVLISGQVDVGLCTLDKSADGEIYANTFRFISSVIPQAAKIVSSGQRMMHRVSFHYQNLRIKLWFCSGIPGTTCGRISKEYFFIFPGGFKFPVSLIVDSFVPYDCAIEKLSALNAEDELADFSDWLVSESMVAGKIESVNRQASVDENRYRMDGIYCCYEMIGRTKAHEIGDVYGKNS